MKSHAASSQNGDPSALAMPAGVRKIPTAMASPATAAAAEPNPNWRRKPPLFVADLGACAMTYKLYRNAGWNAPGPPEPNMPPSVVTGAPKDEDCKYPGVFGVLLSRTRTLA